MEDRVIQGQRQSIQRLLRENHELSTRLPARTTQCADLTGTVRLGQDKHRTAEAKVLHADTRTKLQVQAKLEALERLHAAGAALQALSASEIPWGTLTLGWLLGAATVLIWAFW